MDYVVTLHGFDHARKFRCTEVKDGDDKKKKEPEVLVLIALLVIVVLQVCAVVSAASGLRKSDTYGTDIVVSIISPLMYWVLRFFHKLGPFPKRLKASV